MDERHVGLGVSGDEVSKIERSEWDAENIKKVVTEQPEEHLSKPIGSLISETINIMEEMNSTQGHLKLEYSFPRRKAKVTMTLDIDILEK